jgi:hypothetical protein
MITEANMYDVMALTTLLNREVDRFNAFSMAMSSVRSPGDIVSVSGYLDAQQKQFDAHFISLASLLGYTVSKVEMEDAQ